MLAAKSLDATLATQPITPTETPAMRRSHFRVIQGDLFDCGAPSRRLLPTPSGRRFPVAIVALLRCRQTGSLLQIGATMPPLRHSGPISPAVRFAGDLGHGFAFSRA
jgi:hypothetical protein